MIDPIKTIGTKLTGNEQRDAVHIAIMPVVLGEKYMRPGQRVKLKYGTKNTVIEHNGYGKGCIGAIDPFLSDEEMEIGNTVWLFLTPGTVTGMRHEWESPSVDNVEVTTNESELCLRKFAEKWNFDYDTMIVEAQSDEGYVVAQGRTIHSASELDSGDENLFWYHIEKLTGKQFDEDHRRDFGWSCSC